MSQGFIQLHRKIQEEWFWNHSKLSHLMVDLILRANHEPKEVSFKGEKRTINRGEHITTYRDIAQDLGSSKSTIERLIKQLIKGDELEIIPTKATHIRVVKYDYYLNDDFSPKMGNAWDKDGTRESLNNNDNNEDQRSLIEFLKIFFYKSSVRIQLLEKFISNNSDFAMAYYELSNEFSEKNLGIQSIHDKRRELAALTSFVKLIEEGNPGVDLIQISQVTIESPEFRNHVTKLHPEYLSFLKFILPINETKYHL